MHVGAVLASAAIFSRLKPQVGIENFGDEELYFLLKGLYIVRNVGYIFFPKFQRRVVIAAESALNKQQGRAYRSVFGIDLRAFTHHHGVEHGL